MTAAHTPGPWYWRGNTLAPVNVDPDTSHVHSILDAEGGFGFIGTDHRLTNAELDADRRLIEAAPDLLAALQEAEMVLAEKLRRLGADPNVSPTTHRIRAAIAKAIGGTA